jgi:hypothetical protein
VKEIVSFGMKKLRKLSSLIKIFFNCSFKKMEEVNFHSATHTYIKSPLKANEKKRKTTII